MKDFFKKFKDVFVKSVPDTSPSGTVNKTDLAKVAKTGILVGVASAISYALANIAPDTFGHYQPLVVLGLTAALDLLNKAVKSNK
jgi:hypothetical protein